MLETSPPPPPRVRAEEPKSFARRDRLAAMEGPAQERWKADKIFETKAEFNEDGSPKEKFMVTFPYPYMNGRLHLGHAYSMSKVQYCFCSNRKPIVHAQAGCRDESWN